MMSSVLHAIPALIGAAAVAGSVSCSVRQPHPRARVADPPTQMVAPGDFTYMFGETPFPWSAAEKYLSTPGNEGTDDLFVPDFPAASHDVVQLCEHCHYVDVEIEPERGTHLLTVADFSKGMYVIARVKLTHELEFPATGRLDSVTVLTGLGSPGNVAYLVAISSDRAAFMYRSGDFIAFTTPWKFDPENHPDHALGSHQARWKREPDVGPAARGSREHLSGAWLSCAEGCCSATTIG